MRRAVLLLAVVGTVLLLTAGSLLPQAMFRAQDQLEQASAQPVTDQQLSLDLTNPEMGYWPRLADVGGGNYSATGLDEKYMTRTGEEALALAWALLEEYEAYIPNLYGLIEIGVHSSLCWGGDNSTFRIWNVVLFDYDISNNFCSIILDDETGLPLSIYCSYSSDEGRWGAEGQDLLTLCQSLLAPFETRLEEAGLTRASLSCYADTGVPGSGVVFDLEYGGEQPATMLVWLGEERDQDLSWSVNVLVSAMNAEEEAWTDASEN